MKLRRGSGPNHAKQRECYYPLALPDSPERVHFQTHLFDAYRSVLIQQLVSKGRVVSKEANAIAKVQATSWEAREWLLRLCAAARDGKNLYAVSEIVDTTKMLIDFLERLADAKPQPIKDLARSRREWPVVATVESDWAVTAKTHLDKLELGADWKRRRAKSSKAKPRQWAELTVEVLTLNRDFFQLPNAARDFTAPQWATECAGLPPFNKSNLLRWWKVGKAMLLEQCPTIHKHSDWKSQRREVEASGLPTPARIRTRFLET